MGHCYAGATMRLACKWIRAFLKLYQLVNETFFPIVFLAYGPHYVWYVCHSVRESVFSKSVDMKPLGSLVKFVLLGIRTIFQMKSFNKSYWAFILASRLTYVDAETVHSWILVGYDKMSSVVPRRWNGSETPEIDPKWSKMAKVVTRWVQGTRWLMSVQ
jgi:hypothetical protein